MEGTGIQPVMSMNPNSGTSGFFGNEGIWLFAILALMWGGGGLFGGRNLDGRAATTDDVVNVSAFNQLQTENQNLLDAIRQTTYDNAAVVKDVAYNNLSEIRDLESVVSAGFANQSQCCCNTLRAIDSVNYNNAINTASINANTTASMQKILDAMSADKIASQQARINQLELNQALCGVVRYPLSTVYTSGVNPFCQSGCGCGF